MAKNPKKQPPPNKPKRTASLTFDLGVHYQMAVNDHRRTIEAMIELGEQLDALNSNNDDSQEAQLVDNFHGLEKTKGMCEGKLYRLERLLKHKLNRHHCAIEPIVEFHATDWLNPIAEQKMKNSLDVLRSKRLAKLNELRRVRRKAAQQQRRKESQITELDHKDNDNSISENNTASPALKANEAAVLRTLATLDPSELLSIDRIKSAMKPVDRRASRTIGLIMKRLIELGLAERPSGSNSGARITLPGRGLLRKIAE